MNLIMHAVAVIVASLIVTAIAERADEIIKLHVLVWSFVIYIALIIIMQVCINLIG